MPPMNYCTGLSPSANSSHTSTYFSCSLQSIPPSTSICTTRKWAHSKTLSQPPKTKHYTAITSMLCFRATNSISTTVKKYSCSTLLPRYYTMDCYLGWRRGKAAAGIKRRISAPSPMRHCLSWKPSSISSIMGSCTGLMIRPNQSPRFVHGIPNITSCSTGTYSGSKGIPIITWTLTKYTLP